MTKYTVDDLETLHHETYDNLPMPFVPEGVLSVKLLRFRNIKQSSWYKSADTPDPQFRVTCPNTAEAELKQFETQNIKDDVTCGEINQTFKFIIPKTLDALEDFPIHIDLYDRDVFSNEFLGRVTIDGAVIKFDENAIAKTVKFGKKGELDVVITKSIRTTPDFRYSLGLCPNEKEFRKKRTSVVSDAMKKMFNHKNIPNSPKETPVVSLVCSGGGYRAVIGMCGAMEALSDAGLLDTITYMSGLSGSAWYMTAAYGLQMASAEKLKKFHEDLKQRMSKSLLLNMINPITIARSKYHLKKVRDLHDQPITFADYFPGYLVSNELLGEKVGLKLSDLVPYVHDAKVPFPLFIALHVRNKTVAGKYHAYVERSPYEVYLPSYGIGLDPKTEGSVWNKGFIVRQCPEYPLQFTVAMTGCAMSILLNKFLKDGGELDISLVDYIDKERIESKKLIKNCSQKDKSIEIDSDDDDDTDEEEEVLKDFAFNATETNNNDNTTDHHTEAVHDVFTNDEQLTHGSIQKAIRNSTLFTSRNGFVGRTAKLFNFVFGFEGLKRYRLNPVKKELSLGAEAQHVINKLGMEDVSMQISSKKKTLSMADAGILLNVPSSAALRPQRTTDVMIVMDFSAEESDNAFTYKTLMAAAAHAWRSGLKFPNINFEEIKNLPPKEFLIFPSDSVDCPTVLWFTLHNKKFKSFKNYVPKSTERPPNGESKEFNDFPVFDEGNFCSTFTFQYDKYNFDQLRELMYYNVTLHIEEIKKVILEAAMKKNEKLAKNILF